MTRRITKREFLKLSALGGCGLLIPFKGITATDRKHPGKFSREAIWYNTTPRGVICGICPNECTLKPGEVSVCHNRINIGNKLYSIAYGNPCAVHVDPVEKKPLFHFLPQTRSFSIATAGCNFVCLNCQNWQISQTSPDKTVNADLMPGAVVANALKHNCATIAYTYSEPVSFYEYMFDTAQEARKAGVKNVMISNGFINPEPLKALIPYLDAANIDLKLFDNNLHLKLTGGKLQPVLDTLVTLLKSDVWLEITHLIIPSWSDDLALIGKMCRWLADSGFRDVPIHFSRFSPIHKLTQLPVTPLATLIKARETALKAGLRYVYIGNVPGKGFEDTVCPECRKTVVERRGFSILANHIKKGSCSFCNTPVAGVWNS